MSYPKLPPRGFLTISDVSEQLGVSVLNVAKLIQEDKLKAIRREQDVLIPGPALSAYLDRENGRTPVIKLPEPISISEARKMFEKENGETPESCMEKWKKDLIEDSAENMGISIDAISILLEESEKRYF